MAKVFRPVLKVSVSKMAVSKSAFLGLALIAIMSLTPRPAQAQFAVFDGTSYAAILTQTTQYLTSQFQQMFGPDGMNNIMEKLAATNTNNSTMSNGILAKGVDKLSSDSYTLNQQDYQSKAADENATGALAFQRGNLCQQTTLVAGRSSMRNAMATELAGYNTYRAGTVSPTLSTPTQIYSTVGGTSSSSSTPCASCGSLMNGAPSPPGVVSAEFIAASPATRTSNWIAAMKGFYGASEGGTDGSAWNAGSSGYSASDTAAATHLDVDAISMSALPVYSDVVRMAHDLFANYIVGDVPAVVTPAAFKSNPAGLSSAMIAQHQNLAFYNLASEAFAQERHYHGAATTGAAASVTAIYKSENLADPSFKNGVSWAALDHTLYESPADDPNFAVNLVSQNAKTLLETMDNELMLLNNIEYKRYLQETEMYKIQSAQLALQVRSFDFAGHQ